MKETNYHFEYCYENPYCDPELNKRFKEYMEAYRFDAIANGSSLSKYYLGLCFEKRGLEGDLIEAAKWYKESGHVYAELRLAIASNTPSEKRSRVLGRYTQVKKNFESKIYWLERDVEKYDLEARIAEKRGRPVDKNALINRNKRHRKQTMFSLGAVEQDLNKVKAMIAFLKSKIRYFDFLIEEEKMKQTLKNGNYWGPKKQREVKRSQQFVSRMIKTDAPRELLIEFYREFLSKGIHDYKMDEENTKLALCWLEDYLTHL